MDYNTVKIFYIKVAVTK